LQDGEVNIEKQVGEGTNSNLFVPQGWNRRGIQPGDQITATEHPARNATNFMRIEKVVPPNGIGLMFEGPGGT